MKSSNCGQPLNAERSDPISAPANEYSYLLSCSQPKKASRLNNTSLFSSSTTATSASESIKKEIISLANLNRSNELQLAITFATTVKFALYYINSSQFKALSHKRIFFSLQSLR